ncbi:DUF2953 domain-containing protein [Clostridium sp. Marseille-Q2269]|uniref:DUF2953 domain-containing protein n=1 Tax=Clostridium sp. Marseille-Q2269 TaxID=2942205 RepID=UPI0020732E8B|nr:DUF2953 domain-containing protein [Clostridium sp. Marseille-Q2269]
MLFFIISIFIIFILILTIPLKLTIFYHNKELNIYLYNFLLKKQNYKHKNKEDKSFSKKTNNKKFNNKKNALKITLENCKFKPKVIIKALLDYDLDDAAYSAIIYGFLQSILPQIYNFLCRIFKVKNFNYNITPLFKNRNFLDFKFKGILYISLVKIIYIYISYKINYKNLKKA